MEHFDDIELQDCPLCQGAGCLEEEGGWCLYVQCLDCGCHTAELAYNSPEERREMARRAARTWNLGKVIYPGPGD
ncbi:MAG: hypothetical protein HFF64_07405 [Oscillospiraceae bacterium]|nr:hypothetical protein [Oscillospiraceae bacterium]